MPTRVFISWSGELSRKLAEALCDWLPGVLQHVKPYFTPEDIEKGARWSSDIAHELEECNVGLICLTPDNTSKPWILFEAGALSKRLEESRVCTVLFNLGPTDLKGPLAMFQGTTFVKQDFKRLLTTINNAGGGDRLDAPVLESVFEMWWPKLHAQVTDLLSSHDSGPSEQIRNDRDILEEILNLTRIRAAPPSIRTAYTEVLAGRAMADFVGAAIPIARIAVHADAEGTASHLVPLFRSLETLTTTLLTPEINAALSSAHLRLREVWTELDRWLEESRQNPAPDA